MDAIKGCTCDLHKSRRTTHLASCGLKVKPIKSSLSVEEVMADIEKAEQEEERMTFEEFKDWVAAAKELGVEIVFGPGSKAPEEFKQYAEQEFQKEVKNAG